MDAKEKKREYMRLYYQANKEKIKAHRAAHTEEIKEQMAAYRAAHTEEIKEQRAAYRAANIEEIKTKKAAHYKEHHREASIYDWKRKGICLRPDETWNGVYDKYKATTHCESCEVELDDSSHNTHRCHDHSHEGDCYIRGTVCQLCNTHDRWKKRMTPGSIYQKY